ncbi:MAG: sodium:solute symporter [Burkholderiaceae bacterium]
MALGALSTLAIADSLVSLKPVALPALDIAEPLRGMGRLDGRLLAFSARSAWWLDATRVRWSALPRKPDAEVQGVVGNGVELFAITGESGGTQRVVRLLAQGDTLEERILPPLPQPLTQVRGAILKDVLLLTGKAVDGVRMLAQIRYAEPASRWTVSPSWPGDGAAVTLVGQSSALYAVVDGSAAGSGDRLWRWTSKDGWIARGHVPGTAVDGAGVAVGQAHIVYLVRKSDGHVQPMTYQTITGAWAALPGAEATGTQIAAAWGNGLVWMHRTMGHVAFDAAEIEPGRPLLHWLDWVVIVVYLIAMLGIGLYFYVREKRASTSEFFVGGRSIPFWAAGVSLYVANTSSISYIAIPAKSFESNWQYMTNNLVAVVGLMFVAIWIVPLLRRLDLMSVFQYLELRFHPAIRVLASALFIAVQIGSRMSVILFLPALAIATITGLDVVWSIVIMGGFTIAYTALGGMKAVIWTDFVQLFVKMGGALFAIGFIVYRLKGGFGELLAVAGAADKTRLFDFSFDLTKATVWGFLFLVLFDVVLTFPKDQVLMQRTLSTSSAKEAGRSVWAFAALMIPGGFVFYSIGTALFVYYQANPERMNPLLTIDATFPLFIAAELPMGVTGLIIAGILAAAMATLSSIMNSVATLASVDFYEKIRRRTDQARSVRFAEWMTVLAGLFAIGAALLLSRFDVHSLFDVSIELAGLLGGGFAGAYTLGMFTRRANSPGVAIGVASSIVLTTIAWSMSLVHPYFYLAISIFLCIVIGYLASLLFPAPTRSLEGLTIYTPVLREPAPAVDIVTP